MSKTITIIEALSELPKRTKVAAYARVSSGKEAMLNSLATQVSHYKNLIQSNHEWQFAGVYADEATTGTKDSRDEFQSLLKDARAGKIDMIITKSISRFARNTLTLLATVRELKALNVDVYFEEQNIHTISGEGEMILTFLATFAQEESRSVSENMKWRIKKDFEKGIIWGGNSCLGYKLENRQFHIVPEEAETVRLIYELYLEGHSDEGICTILDSKGIKPYLTKKWNRTSVIKILTNYNYTGNLLLQKTYRDNHINKVQKINKGEHNKYMAKDSHEAIIDMKTFIEAQEIRRLKTVNIKPSANNNSPFKGKMKCGICNKSYTFKKNPYNIVWMCSTSRTKGKDKCGSKQVPDDKVMEAATSILNLQTFDEKNFIDYIDSIIVMPENRLVFKFYNEETKEYVWEYESRSKSWTNEMKEQARAHYLKRNKGGFNY